MKRTSFLAILIICLLSLSGCWDKNEVEDNIFAVLIGIDKAENSDIIATIAFPPTQSESGGDYSVMSVKAPTVIEAMNMFSIKLSGPLALYSVKTIVISQEIAQSNMLRQVFASWRYEDIRNTSNILISECKASEFIKARVTDAPIDPLRQEELLLEQANGSAYYKPIGMLELLVRLKSGSGDGVAMYGGISAEGGDSGKKEATGKQNDDNEKNEAEIKESVKDGYLPDEVPIKADNKSQISGLAVFRGSKMVGALNSMEAQAYSMLTQNEASVILTLPDPFEPEFNIVAKILPAGKNKILSAIKDGVAVFEINVSLKCTVECIQSEADYTLPENYAVLAGHIQKACEQDMASLIRKVQKEYNADILKLGDKLAYRFSTTNEWEKFNWPEQYKNAQISLNVSMDAERTGIMMP